MTIDNSKMHRSKGHKTSSSSSHSSVSTSSSSNPEADRRSQLLREFQTSVPENKVCFDCGQKGPTYVNMTVGAFVCTKCSGMLRGITPPQRIKSISMSAFSSEEVDFVRSRGNLWAQKVWLGLYDSSRLGLYDAKDDEGLRSFIIEKYEKKRYYVDPSTIRHSLSNSSSIGSTGIEPPPMQAKPSLGSGLIGATLNSRVQQKQQQQQQQQQPNISVSRPGVGLSNGSVSRPLASSNTLLSELSAPSVARSGPLQAQPPTPLSKPTPSPSQATDTKKSDPFASNANNAGSGVDSFADFSTANFDAPTPDPIPSRPPVGAPAGTASSSVVPPTGGQQTSAKKSQEAQDKYAALKNLDDIFRTSVSVQEVAPTIASSSTPSTGVSLFGSSPVQPMGGHMSAASTSGAASPPTVGNLSVGAGGDNWAAAWHDSGKMNVSSGSSNRSAVSSPPAVNPFSVATNLTQLNTSPWPSSSGTSPVSQPSKNHHQQQQQRHIPSQQQQPQPQQPAQAQATFTPQWPSSSATAINDPFNISNVNLGENDNDLFAKAPKPFSSALDSGFGANVFDKGAQMNNNGSAAIGSPSTSSSSSNAAAFDAFLNVIADSANKTAPAAAAAAAASNVDQNPWTSEPPKRSTNPFR